MIINVKILVFCESFMSTETFSCQSFLFVSLLLFSFRGGGGGGSK